MSDFSKKVSDLYRQVKHDVNGKAMDREIKEQVNSDLDGLIEKHENPKSGKNTSPLNGKYW